MKRPVRQKSKSFGIDIFIWLIALSGEILSAIGRIPIINRLSIIETSSFYYPPRFHGVCRILGKLMPKGRYTCIISLNPDSVMKIHLDEPYWARLVAASFEYEASFRHVLSLLQDIPYVCVDCGANYGYWSVLLSSRQFGSHRVLAVEAAPETFAILQENCTLNNERFDCANFAISDLTGHKVGISRTSEHYATRVIRETAHESEDEHIVTTVTLDDLIRRYFSDMPDYLLVKLDIEGEEINAFKGVSELLSRDVLFYYEDHGNDPESLVTQYVLEELGLTVLFCTDDGRIIRVHTVEEASQYKTLEDEGFNFIACKEQSCFLQALSESRNFPLARTVERFA